MQKHKRIEIHMHRTKHIKITNIITFDKQHNGLKKNTCEHNILFNMELNSSFLAIGQANKSDKICSSCDAVLTPLFTIWEIKI